MSEQSQVINAKVAKVAKTKDTKANDTKVTKVAKDTKTKVTKAKDTKAKDTKAKDTKANDTNSDVDSTTPPKEDVDLANKYRGLSEIEHVLEAPDMHIGTVNMITEPRWVVKVHTPVQEQGTEQGQASEQGTVPEQGTEQGTEQGPEQMVQRELNYIPGLLKLFDEAIVNCRDQSVRLAAQLATELGAVEQAHKTSSPAELSAAKKKVTDAIKLVTYIGMDVDQTDGKISLCNDGNGIDVANHPVSNLWIPEMIFAHLRTGTNYNKSEERIVGGKNGLGAKLIFIWSTWGKIETVDHIRGLHYEQEFSNNLGTIHAPKITKVKASSKPYTRLTFIPDYARMGVSGLDSDMFDLFRRRAYDIAGITDKKVSVWFNGSQINVRTFSQYVDMYIPPVAKKCIYEQSVDSDRWEYAVCLSPFYKFTSVSFVNGICTHQGGKHVDYIADQIVKKIVSIIEQKRKIIVKGSFIKEQIMLFVRCDIVNPSFDSQSKNRLDTPIAKFGSACTVSDKFIQKVAGLVMDEACQRTEMREDKQLKSVVDGTKTSKVHDIEQLTDASYAGTNRSRNTVMIITEGDSAKAGVTSGMSTEDLKNIGVFAARGKLLNVRKKEINLKDVSNKTFRELVNIMKSVGLKLGEVYNTWEDVYSKLRYGRIRIFTDQDKDGSHIKGLVVNFLQFYWPSLFRLDGFIQYQNTPLIIVSMGKAYRPGSSTNIEFYNQGDFESWYAARPPSEHWYIKYFKGLGTSSSIEFTRYMKNPRIVNFTYSGQSSDDKVDMWFNHKRANDRSHFLEHLYDPTTFIDMTRTEVSYDEFYDHEMSHFSNYDNQRNIAHMVDGLKPSFRKILFSAVKRNLTSEIKVAQFAGYVSEHSGCHHGEASLHATIIHMAQIFAGSNNIPLLWPCGQFGTRCLNGKDAASPRYIYTHLSEITRYIIRKEDEVVLNYLTDDGMPIEPDYYLPVLPVVLFNGTCGIGTGWSSDVPQYSPQDLLKVIRLRIAGAPGAPVPAEAELIPHYDNFRGTIAKLPDATNKYLVKGVYTIPKPNTVVITEIPIGVAYDSYKTTLKTMETSIAAERAKLDVLKKEIDKKRKDRADDPQIKSLEKELAGNVAKLEFLIQHGLVITDVNPAILPNSIQIVVTFEKPLSAECQAGSSAINCSLLEKHLDLGATISTGNMMLYNEHGRIQKYNSPEEIIDAFMPIRLRGYHQRKSKQLSDMRSRLPILENKARFVREITDKTLVVFGLTGEETNQLLRNKKYYQQEDSASTTDNNRFAYLLDMKMGSLVRENMVRLESEYRNLAAQIQTLEATTPEQLWLADLENFESHYGHFVEMREQLLRGDGEPELATPTPPVKKSKLGLVKTNKNSKK